jgi:hypothetical protein
MSTDLNYINDVIRSTEETAAAIFQGPPSPSPSAEGEFERSPSELLRYFAENGITTLEEMKAEMRRWGIQVKTEGEIHKLCHTEKTNHQSPIYWFTNGVVMTMIDGKFKIIVYSFRRMEDRDDEFNEYEGKSMDRIRTELISELVTNPGKKLFLITLLEGIEITVVRSYTGKLLVSTRRMIHAKDSKWGSRDHETLFYEALGPAAEPVMAQIQPGFTYTFLLTHPETSRVIEYRVPKVYITGIRNMEIGTELAPMLDCVDHLPAIEVTSETYLPYIEHLNTPEVRRDIVGYILRDEEFHYQKFTSPMYKKMAAVFGNNPSPMFRYFTLRREPEELRKFLEYFPRMAPLFESFERNLLAIANECHKLYCAMYIKKSHMFHLPPFLKALMGKLHGPYLESRKNGGKPIINTVERILEYISKQDIPLICDIYNKMILNGSGPITYDSLVSSASPFEGGSRKGGAGAGNH